MDAVAFWEGTLAGRAGAGVVCNSSEERGEGGGNGVGAEGGYGRKRQRRKRRLRRCGIGSLKAHNFFSSTSRKNDRIFFLVNPLQSFASFSGNPPLTPQFLPGWRGPLGATNANNSGGRGEGGHGYVAS